MDLLPKSLRRVMESFEKLPGIGPKTAQRLSFYLLHMPQDELIRFSDSIRNLKISTQLCSVCKNTTETPVCLVCGNARRDHSMICVVEQPTDVLSIERTGTYQGIYHVLHGAIDPLNNIGPDEIYIQDLMKRIQTQDVAEIILASNPNMEGEATALYIQKEIHDRFPDKTIRISRLAHGLPVGADLEYADEVTLQRAIEGRRQYD